MRLVPIDKFDDEACENLKAASDEELRPSKGEVEEEALDVVCELLRSRTFT